MKVECYGDEFVMYLTELVRDEGALERRRLFEQFVQGATFTCGRCREEFTTKGAGVEEDDEVLCSRCRKRA
jgi:DNA-directed RNA polymerase subunit RPC12/RpoP